MEISDLKLYVWNTINLNSPIYFFVRITCCTILELNHSQLTKTAQTTKNKTINEVKGNRSLLCYTEIILTDFLFFNRMTKIWSIISKKEKENVTELFRTLQQLNWLQAISLPNSQQSSLLFSTYAMIKYYVNLCKTYFNSM